MTRKVILGFGISTDGVYGAAERCYRFSGHGQRNEAPMADFFAKIDTTVIGRKTAVATVKLRKSGEMPEMAGISNYAVSRRWKPGKREGFESPAQMAVAF